MLRNNAWLTLAILAAMSIFGCSKTDGPQSQSQTSKDRNFQQNSAQANRTRLEPPAAAVYDFLEAVRTGNDEKATKMLSTTAREKAAALNRNITPPASDTARFTIGKVQYVGEDGAQVASTWIDIDDEGQSNSDGAVWVLRREGEGWRVAGVAAIIFPGESPLLLNFEDPEDMIKKQQWVREEIRRRTEKDNLQAKEADNSGNSFR